MALKYRTFKDGDEPGILKLFHGAFCQSRFCQPRTEAFWNWRYKKNPFGFIPEGIQLVEKNGIIVGSVLVSFHKMQFGNDEFFFGAIDDVATCPVLQRRGIARKLMENAIEFTKSQGADGSVLMADPGGHARILYEKLGYTFKTFYSINAKIINPLKFKKQMTPLFPFAPLLYILSLRIKKKKKLENIEFELLKRIDDEFIHKLNMHLKNYSGSNIYDRKYWKWFRIDRPKRSKAINITIRKDNKLIGGGSLLKSRILAIKYHINLFILADLFVDPQLRKEGIGNFILNKLESIAALESPLMLAVTHVNDIFLNKMLKENGFFSIQNADLEMINPISKEVIDTLSRLKSSNKPWIPPLEQAGF